jgi:hypothetical protein
MKTTIEKVIKDNNWDQIYTSVTCNQVTTDRHENKYYDVEIICSKALSKNNTTNFVWIKSYFWNGNTLIMRVKTGFAPSIMVSWIADVRDLLFFYATPGY